MKRRICIGILASAILLIASVAPLSAPICGMCEAYCDGNCNYTGWFEFNDCTCNLCPGLADLHCEGRCNKYDCYYGWPWGWGECWSRVWETSECDACCD